MGGLLTVGSKRKKSSSGSDNGKKKQPWEGNAGKKKFRGEQEKGSNPVRSREIKCAQNCGKKKGHEKR